MSFCICFFFFFFQAEDGIRDVAVTGVQTCALPIFDRDGAGDVVYHQHVGVYAYTREALERWVRLPPVPAERWERLEQLRPLLHGVPSGVPLPDPPAAPGLGPADDLRPVDTLPLREPSRVW